MQQNNSAAPEPAPVGRTTAPSSPRPAVGRERSFYAPAPDHGYWGFMVTAVIFLFIFYVAGKGELKQWIDVLVWNPATAPKAGGAGQAPGAGGEVSGPGGAAGVADKIAGGNPQSPSVGSVLGGSLSGAGAAGGTVLPYIKKFLGF